MKRILVGLDRTEESSFVLASAIDLARSMDAKIRLVRAIAPPVANTEEAASFSTMLDDAIERAEQALASRLSHVPARLRDGTVVQVGSPAEVICETAKVYGADLVVIGAHRHGLLARALGTTAARVVDRIDRPTFVVRPVATPKTTGASADVEHA